MHAFAQLGEKLRSYNLRRLQQRSSCKRRPLGRNPSHRRTKGRKGGVEALRNDSGVSVTSTKGKL